MHSLVNPQIHSSKKTAAITSSKRCGLQRADDQAQIPTLSPVCLSIKRNKDRRHRHKRPEMLSNVWGCQAEVVYYEDVFAQRHGGEPDMPPFPCLFGGERSQKVGSRWYLFLQGLWAWVEESPQRWVQLVWHMGQKLSSIPQVLKDSTVKAGNITL